MGFLLAHFKSCSNGCHLVWRAGMCSVPGGQRSSLTTSTKQTYLGGMLCDSFLLLDDDEFWVRAMCDFDDPGHLAQLR